VAVVIGSDSAPAMLLSCGSKLLPPMAKILCIDDDERALETLFALLATRKYECYGAETPIQARARFIVERPDLVIIDHGLPGENGASLATALKNIRNTPVLMLTGRSEVPKPHDVDKLLIKPQEPEAILSAVAELLRSSKSQVSKAGRL
jgi:two-component system, OmpR family, phosphate regulon response regulator OmpR